MDPVDVMNALGPKRPGRSAAPRPARGAGAGCGCGQGWTLMLLSIGIGVIACCVLIPQADENRRMHWEAEKLRVDLEAVQKQVQVNDEFVHWIGHDPVLAERLAQRQMKFVRKGTGVLELGGEELELRSPYLLTSIPTPPPMPEYRPVGGRIAELCRDPKSRLYLLGGGLMLMACGLVLGHTPRG